MISPLSRRRNAMILGRSYNAPVPRGIVPTSREFHGAGKKKVDSNKMQ